MTSIPSAYLDTGSSPRIPARTLRTVLHPHPRSSKIVLQRAACKGTRRGNSRS